MRPTAYDIIDDGVSDPEAGPVLGRYELISRTASGGMATVWAARLRGSRGFQKIVALKTILPRFCADAKYERMFLDEATFAGQIRHPNVAQILDLGEDNGVLFLAMEWIDGVTVLELLREAHTGAIEIPLSVAIRIAIQAASGLHAAHELRNSDGNLVGLVHGDVSPQNIIVSFDGVTKLLDFGIAKLTSEERDESTLGAQVRGKVAYLAPEQITGAAVDRRADQFALGVILYVLTTGTHPFQGRTSSSTLFKISGADSVRRPSDLVEDYPAELDATVMRCLEKDPARRFATCDELVWALESSIPSELRATDQDVAVLVRSLSGSVGARRFRAARLGAQSSFVPAKTGAGTLASRSLTSHRANTISLKLSGPKAAKTYVQKREKSGFRPLVLCAALAGSVGALAMESVLRATAGGGSHSAPSAAFADALPSRAPALPPHARLELPARRTFVPPARPFGRTISIAPSQRAQLHAAGARPAGKHR